jgi:hypothetical protein
MAKSKKMNESKFGKLTNELHALGEEIRSHQDEKQSVVDAYDKERKRYDNGRISEKSLVSSAKKSNSELGVLDGDIRDNINKIKKLCADIREFASNQAPKNIRVKHPAPPGLSKKKPKKKAKKKAARKKKK